MENEIADSSDSGAVVTTSQESEESEQTETTPSPLEEAKNIQVENKKLLEAIKLERVRAEKAFADLMISGKSQINNKPKPVEETAKDYAERVLAGKVELK
jgi:hypothetical protein